MNGETQGPTQSSGEAAPADKAVGPTAIDRRRIILTTLKAAPIVTTLGVTAGRAHADPPASHGASSNSSIKATNTNPKGKN